MHESPSGSRGCQATVSCLWGYSPRRRRLHDGRDRRKFCNLAPTYDFNPSIIGDQDGLLATASSSLPFQTCSADWSGLQGNPPPNNQALRHDGKPPGVRRRSPRANVLAVMGGASIRRSETGAQCGFTFYQVDSTYSGFDTGFRCCFSADPTQ